MRDGTSVVRVPAGGAAAGGDRPDACRAWAGPTVLRLSPDGVRAALVVEGRGGRALYVGTVVRAEDGSVALRDLREIAPALSRVVDVAWRDSGTLLVLAGDAGRGPDRALRGRRRRLGADRGARRPACPASRRTIAAAPDRQPLVSAGRHIWQLDRRHLGHPGARPGAAARARRPSTRSEAAGRPQIRPRPPAPGAVRPARLERVGRAGIAALADLVLPRTCAGCGVPGRGAVRAAARRCSPGPGSAAPRRVPVGLPADRRRRRLRRAGAAGGRSRSRSAAGPSSPARWGRRWRWPWRRS